jgi:HPt (histidine-containing phosphotransfer) domain-containing protein
MADNAVYVNVEEGRKRVMNNAKLYAKLLTKFKTDTNLDELIAALDSGDMEKAQSAVHTIKGISGNLSLSELYKQSVELETQIKQLAVKPDQVAATKNAFAQTLIEIERVIAQND